MWSTVIPGHHFSRWIEFNFLHMYFQCSGILWSVAEDKFAIWKKKNQTKQPKISLCFKNEIITNMSDLDVQYSSLCSRKTFSFIIKGHYHTVLFNIYVISSATFQGSAFFMWLKHTYQFKTCILWASCVLSFHMRQNFKF